MRKSSTCCGTVALRVRASAAVVVAGLAAACSRPAPPGTAAAAERPAPERVLEIARRGGEVAELERLLQGGADVNQRDGSGSTLLALAAAGGHAPLVDTLLARGARVGTHDSSGQTPLTAAVRNGRGDVVKRLLDRGADPNDEVYAWSALRLAAFVGDAASVEALLAKGARVEARSDRGMTALMYAAGRGHEPVVRALLARGAAADARDQGGHTALMFAANGGHAEIARELLQAGADPAARNRAGETAGRLAAANGHDDLVAALGRAGLAPAAWILAAGPALGLRPERTDDAVFADAARQAWRYVESRYRPETGLVDGAVGWEHATMWDVGSALAAFVSARELGLLPPEECTRRVERVLRTLGRVPLADGVTFGRAYATRGGGPRGDGGWSPTDLGRLLLWLKIVAAREPTLAGQAEAVARRSDFARVLRGGYMWGARSAKGKHLEFQEGRLGYEQYAAAGFAAWGFPVDNARSFTRNAIPIQVMGQPVMADMRGFDRLTSDPIVLYGLELGWPDEAKGLARGLLAAQEERWKRTGQVTIVGEDAIGIAPHFFFYYCAYTNAKEFAVDVQDPSAVVSGPRWISSKSAFAWHALLPGEYTRRAVEAVQPAASARGWASGVFEDGRRSTGGENVNTEAIILEAAAYARRGAPLIEAR
jgi:ankyrin repeat protein